MEDFLVVSVEIWKWKQKSYLCANSCVSHVQVTKKLIMDKYLKTFLVILSVQYLEVIKILLDLIFVKHG